MHLKGFRSGYAKAVEKTAEAIAGRLLDHTLWYYVRSTGVPRIIVTDDQIDDPIELSDLSDAHMHGGSDHRTFTIKDVQFNITHVKFRARADRKGALSLCGDTPVTDKSSYGALGWAELWFVVARLGTAPFALLHVTNPEV